MLIKEKNEQVAEKLNLCSFSTENRNATSQTSKKIKKKHKPNGEKMLFYERKMTRFFKKTLNSIQFHPKIKSAIQNQANNIKKEAQEHANFTKNNEGDRLKQEKTTDFVLQSEYDFKDILKELWMFIEKDQANFEKKLLNKRLFFLQKSLKELLHKISLDFNEVKSKSQQNIIHLEFFGKGYGSLLSGIIYILESHEKFLNSKCYFEEIHQETRKLQNEIKFFVFTHFLQPEVFFDFFLFFFIFFNFFYLF